MKKFLFIFLLFIGACTLDTQLQDAGVSNVADVSCPPVVTSTPVQTGDVLSTNLRSFTVDNGFVRLNYGSRSLDFRNSGLNEFGGPMVQNTERHMDHFLEARHTDAPEVATTPGCLGACHNGSHWHDVQYSWYGDGVQFASSGADADADRVHVLLAGQDAVELSYEWDDVRFDSLRSPGVCSLGAYPECGPTERDSNGEAIYPHNAGAPQSVKHAKVWKTVRIERCTPGYFLSMRSDPPLNHPEQGTRAVRLGYITSAVAWDCSNPSNTARHPLSPVAHYLFGLTDCVADIPQDQTGHDGWPFVRWMQTAHPWSMSSLQYSSGQLGSPGVAEMWDVVGADGRAEPWQAFIGATEYASPDFPAEPSNTVLGLVELVEFPQ